MKKTNETDTLNELIILQEQQYETDLRLLKEQFNLAYESIKPINIIKNLVHEVSSSPEIKSDIVSNVIGLTTGFVSKKLLIHSSHNPIKRVLGTVLQFAIANVVSNHTETIKTIGNNVLGFILDKKRK